MRVLVYARQASIDFDLFDYCVSVSFVTLVNFKGNGLTSLA